MILTKEKRILDVFGKKPWIGKTFKKIKKESKIKSDSYVFKTLKKLSKNNILKEKKVGNVINYFLNDSIEAVSLVAYVEEYNAQQRKDLPHNNINEIISLIPTNIYSLLITGSYAGKKQEKTSDLDIVLISCSKTNIRKILASIRSRGELMIPEIHSYVFTEDEFLEMLTNKEENYGKEIAGNNLIICGGEQYLKIIFRAIENGFKG